LGVKSIKEEPTRNILLGFSRRWKSNLLSKGGKLILIKHVLATMPLYKLSLFDAPQVVTNKINTICFNFFYGKNGERNNTH
jgi:hypothetical protein